MCTLWDCTTVLCNRSPNVCKFSWQFSSVCFADLSDCLGAFSTFLAASLWKILACASQSSNVSAKTCLGKHRCCKQALPWARTNS